MIAGVVSAQHLPPMHLKIRMCSRHLQSAFHKTGKQGGTDRQNGIVNDEAGIVRRNIAGVAQRKERARRVKQHIGEILVPIARPGAVETRLSPRTRRPISAMRSSPRFHSWQLASPYIRILFRYHSPIWYQ